jgi:ATP-binding cassette subfamily B (MDR/TAP) protein 1
LVFEAIRQWRKNKTAIVITHDLSQICPEYLVITMKDGINVETGYWGDLEYTKGDHFSEMAAQGRCPPRT